MGRLNEAGLLPHFPELGLVTRLPDTAPSFGFPFLGVWIVDLRSTVVLACHPAGDDRFAQFAEHALGDLSGPNPDELVERIHGSFPNASVQPAQERRHDGEHGAVWHVFREPVPEPFDTRALALVVDDDRITRMLMSQLLQRTGWRVMEADCADVAEARALSEPIDLLVTDDGLPGTSGIELAQILRAQEPGLPVLVVSAGEDAGPRAAALGYGFLRKPYETSDLLLVVSRLVSEHCHVDRRRRRLP